VGASTLVKVGAASHLFRVMDPSRAALAVTFLVLGVPWAASDEEVETLLTLIASPNPRCKLVSWTRVVHRGTVTDKVAARWTIAPEMALMGKSINLGDFSLSFAPQEHSLRCSMCKVKGHDDRRCPFTGDTHPPASVPPTQGSFKSTADFLAAARGVRIDPPSRLPPSNLPSNLEVPQSGEKEPPTTPGTGQATKEEEDMKCPPPPPPTDQSGGTQQGHALPSINTHQPSGNGPRVEAIQPVLPQKVPPQAHREEKASSQSTGREGDKKPRPNPTEGQIDSLLKDARKGAKEKEKEEGSKPKPSTQRDDTKNREKEARTRDAGRTPPNKQHQQQAGFKIDAPDSPKRKLLGGRGESRKGQGPNGH
jgi:hypothetical protein